MLNQDYLAIKEFLVNSPEKDPRGIFLLAHGAGKGMATPFMETIARGVIESGVRVIRFHFPYMEDMLRSGIQRPPDGGRVLRKSFSELITHCVERENVPRRNIIIGGKSMGARVASMIADNHKVAGVICLSYPFHPPKKPRRVRIKHLKVMRTPTLICQGECDPNGRREEVRSLDLSQSIRFHWLAGSDNNFRVRDDSGRSQAENLAGVVQACNEFIGQVL